MNSEVFPKFAVLISPLAVILLVLISKKSLLGVVTYKTTSCYTATF